MSSILKVTEPISGDTSIDKYEYFECEPVTGTNLNNSGGVIRLVIETQDIFTHPSESFLIIEGRLTKADGTAYANANNVSLTNKALMYLFKDIRYDLSNHEIEKIMNLGQATTMLGLLKYPDDFSKSKGLNQSWYKDTLAEATTQNVGWNIRRKYIINDNVDPKDSFSFRIPLKHIFGFCEYQDKVVYGFKHALILTRNNDHEAIFKDAGVDAGKITLSKVSWFMSDVIPVDKDKMELYKIIERKEKLPVGYRMIQSTNASIPQTNSFSWRLSVKLSPEVPRFILVGFQTDRSGDQDKNPSVFDNLNIRNIYVMLNNKRYPEFDYNLSFPANQFSRAYGDAAQCRTKFFNMNELVSNLNITPSDYKTLYPIFLFDVSKQSEKLKYSTTDIQIKMEFNENVPLSTEGYAIIISDRLINFQSDGNKFSVVI